MSALRQGVVCPLDPGLCTVTELQMSPGIRSCPSWVTVGVWITPPCPWTCVQETRCPAPQACSLMSRKGTLGCEAGKATPRPCLHAQHCGAPALEPQNRSCRKLKHYGGRMHLGKWQVNSEKEWKGFRSLPLHIFERMVRAQCLGRAAREGHSGHGKWTPRTWFGKWFQSQGCHSRHTSHPISPDPAAFICKVLVTSTLTEHPLHVFTTCYLSPPATLGRREYHLHGKVSKIPRASVRSLSRRKAAQPGIQHYSLPPPSHHKVRDRVKKDQACDLCTQIGQTAILTQVGVSTARFKGHSFKIFQ